MNRIAIDIDEVLVKFLFPMAKHHHKVHKLWSKPKYNYVYREIFEIDEATSQRMVREFYQSKDFMDLIRVVKSLKKLGMMKKNSVILYGTDDFVSKVVGTKIMLPIFKKEGVKMSSAKKRKRGLKVSFRVYSMMSS